MELKKYSLQKISAKSYPETIPDESKLQIAYRDELNSAQYEAAAAIHGTFLIIAGAGTGKTRTLVYRVARLIELGYHPSSILLLTFTRKAANEMMNRAAILLDKRCESIQGGTFHSFAYATLRKYSKSLGLESGFTILDQGDSEDTVNLVRNRAKIVPKDKRFPTKVTLFKIFSLHVNTGRAIDVIVDEDYPHFSMYTEEMKQLQSLYTSYKRQNNLLDYDDLLVYMRNFLCTQSPALSNLLSGIQFVMVDEYQDTNYLQSEIVKGLAARNNNIMVVGDDSQSIYSFRGANFQNIMRFPEMFPNTKVITLEENFRSTQYILNFANRINDSAVQKYEKLLFTRKTGGELPLIIACTTENMESKFIIDRILQLREEGVSLANIAVLFRSSFYSFDLEIELAKANIPFIKVGGMKFVESAHIKDITAFLRILVNPTDTISWYRVLLLHEGIGPKSAEKVLDLITSGAIHLRHNPEGYPLGKQGERLYPLFKLLHGCFVKGGSPTEIVQVVLEYYMPIFQTAYDDFNKRKKDLDTFLTISWNYKELASFVADLAIEPPVDSVIDIGEESKDDEKLTLSTIHSAKGLEWHSVFLIHANDGFLPFTRSFSNLDSLEEERRLLYVAVTRAKQNLHISYPMNIFDREAGTTLSRPSRFLNGITSDLADGYLLEEEYF